MILKVKKLHEEAILPTRGSEQAAGLDLYACPINSDGVPVSNYIIPRGETVSIPTGIAVEIPDGYWGLLALRSSMSFKRNFYIPNGLGVIDSDYRGELKVVIAYNSGSYLSDSFRTIKAGDRIGQLILVPLPKFDIEVVDKLSDTKRGDGGFGSTGV